VRQLERQPERLPPPPPLPPGFRPQEAPPAVGSIHEGVVESVRPFGLFVSLRGYARQGLVHANNASADMRFSREDGDEDKVKALEWAFPRGQRCFAKVLSVSDDPRGGFRLALSLRAVDQASGADLDPENREAGPGGGGGGGGPGGLSEEPPPLGAVLRGRVADVKPYGLFVSLDGYRRNGLVHSSQVSEHLRLGRDEADEEKVAALLGVVSVGDSVFVKLVEIEPGDGGRLKLGCSMKLVEQRSGRDLDPAGTAYRPRGARGGEGGEAAAEGRREAAVLPGGVVDWGYHRASGAPAAGGQQYELVSEDEGGPPPPPPQDGAPRASRAVTARSPRARKSVEAGALQRAYAGGGRRRGARGDVGGGGGGGAGGRGGDWLARGGGGDPGALQGQGGGAGGEGVAQGGQEGEAQGGEAAQEGAEGEKGAQEGTQGGAQGEAQAAVVTHLSFLVHLAHALVRQRDGAAVRQRHDAREQLLL